MGYELTHYVDKTGVGGWRLEVGKVFRG